MHTIEFGAFSQTNNFRERMSFDPSHLQISVDSFACIYYEKWHKQTFPRDQTNPAVVRRGGKRPTTCITAFA